MKKSFSAHETNRRRPQRKSAPERNLNCRAAFLGHLRNRNAEQARGFPAGIAYIFKRDRIFFELPVNPMNTPFHKTKNCRLFGLGFKRSLLTMPLVDLKELATRESERVEWKRNVADIEDVVRTIVAFANDFSNLGGGYVVCGAEESKDEAGFPKISFIGLNSSRFREVEGKVLAHSREKVNPPIVPLTEELSLPDESQRVLVFIVPATGTAHCYRGNAQDSEKYFIRVGRETREAKNGLLRELLVKRNALEPCGNFQGSCRL